MKTLLTALIKAYSYVISPMTGANCRFYPNCSAYGVQAIERHGAAKGSVMTIKRLLKCHPWHKGDMVDPVPVSIDWSGIIGYKRGHCSAAQNCVCHHSKQKD